MSEYSLAQQCKVFFTLKKINECRDFPGSPVAKTPNAGDPGSIPAWGTISHILQLRVRIYHNEDWRFCVLQLRPGAAKWINKYLKKKKTTVNVIHHIERIKDTNHIISLDLERIFDLNIHSWLKKK